MNNIITFGRYEGKSFEWLFFKAPWYVEFIIGRRIQWQRHHFSEEECEYFCELYSRGSHLAGTICRQCQERPVTYMGLTRLHGMDTLGNISLYCNECDHIGGSPIGYYEPSLFMPYDAPRCEQLRLTTYIKDRYIGAGSLTQAKMEEFFRNDANFARATPSFFARKHAGGVN